MLKIRVSIILFALTGMLALAQSTVAIAQDESLQQLNTRVAQLQHELQLLQDERDIEILQRTYGYYVDKNLWTDLIELFTEEGTLEIGGRGVFVGKESVLEYFQYLGSPVDGVLYDHTQIQPVVSVSPDSLQAKGRWRALITGGDYEGTSFFGNVVYENEYEKVDGKWKISKLYAYFNMYTDFEQGWESSFWENTSPEVDMPPDLPPTVVYKMYPDEMYAPQHYENPVTGRPVFDAKPALSRLDASLEELNSTVIQLREQAGMLADVQAIENLQNAYGFYFDKRQWDQAADLFAEDSRIERGQRGVYVGKDRVRESFNLYGESGIKQGNVNNNMQYQSIIHVSDDGLSANGRLRTLNMHGDYQGDATISAGVYENEYVKEAGVWKIKSDHLYTTFVAGYHKSWAHGALPVPGQSATLPPDLPPTLEYESFPNYYVVPFHYDNPVTGLDPLRDVN